MSIYSFIENLIEKKAVLFAASILLCFGFLGSHDLWTQEHRWADIVSMMFLRDDFLHPYLGSVPYYDKPLLSYWLIAAVVSVTKQLTSATIRIPSAFFGLIGLFSAYRIAKHCYDKKAATLFVWMFLSLFFYIFWARTASADILNVAGILLAVSIYITNREKPTAASLVAFFVVVALTSLCKGIVAAIIVSMVVGIDILLRGTLKRYMTLPFFAALFIGAAVYCVPFMLSAYYPDANFVANQNSGLYLVYKENIVRFIKPFDHIEPFYVYFIYLPLYLFPWIVFFIPALFNRVKQWSRLTLTSKWVLLSFLALFAFFTISGSRRSYYVLPVVPFALLLLLDWLQGVPRLIKSAKILAVSMFAALVVYFMVFQPLFYAQYGTAAFLQNVVKSTSISYPLNVQDVALLGVRGKVAFYLGMSPTSIINSQSKIIAAITQFEEQYSATKSSAALPKVILTNKAYADYIKVHLPHLYDQTMVPNMLRINGKMISDSHEVVALIKHV